MGDGWLGIAPTTRFKRSITRHCFGRWWDSVCSPKSPACERTWSRAADGKDDWTRQTGSHALYWNSSRACSTGPRCAADWFAGVDIIFLSLVDGHSWSREVRGDSHHSPVTGFSPAYFATPAVTVNEGQEYDIDTLQNNLLHKVDQWNKRGSDFNIERVWAGSSCPRSFARRTFWRANTVSSTSKTTTRNASFGACCRRYTQPPITHIVCQSTKITNTISKSRGWLSMSKRNKSPFSVI